MRKTARLSQPSAGTVHKRGVVVYLGNRTGLIREDDTGRQIMFRLSESEIDREKLEVEFNFGPDPRNGQLVATTVRPIRGRDDCDKRSATTFNLASRPTRQRATIA